MKNLFFYGTLAYQPLLETVLGKGLDAAQAQPARLHDHMVLGVKDQTHPMIEPCLGGDASGLLVTGLSAQDVTRLDFYEGGFDYDLRQMQVETAHGAQVADVYFPRAAPVRGASWKLKDWIAAWGDLTVQAAGEAMGYFGQIDTAELTRRFPAIRRRAASFIRAGLKPGKLSGDAGHSRADVTVRATDIAYSNFFAMQEYDIQHRKFNGEMSAVLDRVAFVGFDVAIVLPYDPVRDLVLLVEQFRLGAYARGDTRPWVLEPVAGHVDVGETPEQAARRECEEEAGLSLDELLPIAAAYPSPGCSTEYYYIYLGLCNLAGNNGGVSGMASENEDILSRVLPYDALMDFVDSGNANNQPLILAANWLARNRNRLRAGA
ncbi:MAG: NUDIX domain-containing protein [Marinosulfonomonas sp.]|nr:NUDIX domain-containing protein [Marinosulfonomonas sp.]